MIASIYAGQLVESLAQFCARGEDGLECIPKTVIKIIEENLWREFEQFGTIYRYGEYDFEKFVTAKFPSGLSTTLDTLYRLCSKDSTADHLLGEVTKRPKHVHASKIEELMTNGIRDQQPDVDNVNITTPPQPDGNSKRAGHRRLAKDRPDLHERVLRDEMTVHEAMVEAGFRKPNFTISIDPESAARTIIKKYALEDIEKLVAELQHFLASVSEPASA